MRFGDMLRLAGGALAQHKLRTVLTTLGVLFGSFVLALSLSIREGVQETITREYSKFGELRQVHAHPHYKLGEADVPAEKLELPGKMSDVRRERIRRAIRTRWRQQNASRAEILIDSEMIESLRKMEHVKAVETTLTLSATVSLGEKSEYAMAWAAPPLHEGLRERLLIGQPLTTAGGRGILISEYMAHQLGATDDADVPELIGKSLRLEVRDVGQASPGALLARLAGSDAEIGAAQMQALDKVAEKLPEILAKLELPANERAAIDKLVRQPEKKKDVVVTEEFIIAGVYRMAEEEDDKPRPGWSAPFDVDLVLPQETGESLFWRLPQLSTNGTHHVSLEVDDVENVKEVDRQLRAKGLRTYSLALHIEREKLTYLIIFTSMTIVALVALLVSALGIINTMLMSVLERTREIGVMKAVGARDGHIQLLFLLEGGLIGVVGGGLGLLFAWLATMPADAWTRAFVKSHMDVQLEESMFAFPWWLLAGVPVFAWLVTTLAAYYPARRAARVNPITALRHD